MSLPQPASAMQPPTEDALQDPLDHLLREIIHGFFVLTDGQGAVSKWGEPADLLFGRDAAEVLGRPFFGPLIETPCSADGEAWRRFLETGEPPSAPARVEVVAQSHRGGETFPVELVFVPVKLDRSE